MSELFKYGVAATIYFPLIKAGSNNFAVSGDYTHASGDVKITKDGGAAATATNAPSAITMGNGAIWKLDLTATEMQAGQIVVTIIDATTKAIEDQAILIQTYGNASALHAFDLDTATQAVTVSDKTGFALTSTEHNNIADALLKRDWTAVTGEAARSVLNALRFLRNKWSVSGTTLTVTKEDDSTSAWTASLTTTAASGADVITSSDPT